MKKKNDFFYKIKDSIFLIIKLAKKFFNIQRK